MLTVAFLHLIFEETILVFTLETVSFKLNIDDLINFYKFYDH